MGGQPHAVETAAPKVGVPVRELRIEFLPSHASETGEGHPRASVPHSTSLLGIGPAKERQTHLSITLQPFSGSDVHSAQGFNK